MVKVLVPEVAVLDIVEVEEGTTIREAVVESSGREC
jgi:putative ubiquitin-RnfH superfamily antitoxin RatB of RatAB toxin-antitoxin module